MLYLDCILFVKFFTQFYLDKSFFSNLKSRDLPIFAQEILIVEDVYFDSQFYFFFDHVKIRLIIGTVDGEFERVFGERSSGPFAFYGKMDGFRKT